MIKILGLGLDKKHLGFRIAPLRDLTILYNQIKS